VIGPYSQTGPALVTLNMRVSKTFGFGEKKGGESQADRKGGGGRGRGNDHGMGGPRGMGNVFGSATTDNRYNLTFSASARNLLNHVNYAPPHANLSNLNNFDTYFAVASGGGFGGSSLFNRRIDLQMSLNF
jgi:hypothetical protein